MTDAFCSISDPVASEVTQSPSFSSPLRLPLLALDIGKKRIGVAVSDRLGLSCRGIKCLHRNDSGWPGQVARIAQEYGCQAIVVGLARNMDGSEGAQARDCRRGAEQLQQCITLPLFFQDERLSTWTAKERLFGQGLSEKKVKEKLDQTAAAVILEDFIATHVRDGVVHG